MIWLTLDEACQHARMSRQTLVRHIKAGRVYAVKRASRWKVDRESIDAWFREPQARLLLLARRAGERRL